VTASSLMCAAAVGFSNVVDVYNGTTGVWSTSLLSVARPYLAAASVGNLALFAGGGSSTSALVCKKESGGGLFSVACGFCVCACCGIAVMFTQRPLPLSCAPLQVLLRLLWIFTTVQQGHGRRLSSAWRGIILQLHLSETSLCSLGVSQQVWCCAVRREGGDCLLLCACVVFARAVLSRGTSVVLDL
jgi:hypothetical protein